MAVSGEGTRTGAVERGRSNGWTLQRAPARRVSEPADRFEAEADRIAATVSAGRTPRHHTLSISRVASFPAQRQGDDKKTQDEKYAEAAKKAGEAFMET